MPLYNIRRGLVPACFLLCAAVFAAVADAQPVPLRPNAAPRAPEENPGPLPGGVISQDAVSAAALPQFDSASAGILGPQNGGFPAGMWAGTGRGLVQQLLPRLPPVTASPALQKLARRLLLSAAEPPAGDAGKGGSLFGLRLAALGQTGAFEAVRALLALAAQPITDEAALKAGADAALAENDLDQACRYLELAIGNSQDVYWLKLSGFCQIRRSDPAAAQLSAALLGEQDTDDAAYQALLASLIARDAAPPETLPDAAPLHLAMIRMAAMPMPAGILETARPAALIMLARMPEIDPELRLKAAEQAAVLGAIEASELAGIYDSAAFSVAERSRAAELAPQQPGGRANALMHQSVRAQDSDLTRAQALATAWRVARASNSFAAVALANHGLARELSPAPEMLGMAAETGRALLGAGDVAAAARWYAMARAMAPSGDVEAEQASQSLWPLLRLATGNSGTGGMMEDSLEFVTWLDGLPPEARQEQGLLMLSMLAALGFETPPAVWEKLTIDTLRVSRETPPPALLHLLGEAGRGQRIGETVLLSLICLDGRLDDPLVLGEVLRALRQAGLGDAAREIAVDAALLAGM